MSDVFFRFVNDLALAGDELPALPASATFLGHPGGPETFHAIVFVLRPVVRREPPSKLAKVFGLEVMGVVVTETFASSDALPLAHMAFKVKTTWPTSSGKALQGIFGVQPLIVKEAPLVE